jgi:hypothetical protein
MVKSITALVLHGTGGGGHGPAETVMVFDVAEHPLASVTTT